MGNNSSALSLSFLDLSDFPKYVVLKSEFSSTLVVFAISDWTPSYTSRYSSFNTSSVGQSLSLLCLFLSLHLNHFCKHLLHYHLSCENSLGAYHTVCNLMCYSKLTTNPFVLTMVLSFLHYLLSFLCKDLYLHSHHLSYLIAFHVLILATVFLY